MTLGHLAHWDDVEPFEAEIGHLGGAWLDLGEAARTRNTGVVRAKVSPGKAASPVHRHGREEEIAFVLGGGGLSWQDGETYEIRPGDCVVHRAMAEAHTLLAGPGGLDVLIFGQRAADEATQLPRAGVVRINETWVLDEGGAHPWEREAAAGPPERPEPSPRPDRIVALADLPPETERQGRAWVEERDLGRAAGSDATGLCHVRVPAGFEGWPPHCHSLEEEIFVVLEGAGTLTLGDEEQAVRPGHVVGRPAGTGVAHAFRAAEDADLTYLAYGTREPNDICFYPRSNKIAFRGVKVRGRIERLDYWDGEPV